PPTAGEAAGFVNDRSPDAYEKLIGRLLGSPRYGERYARHWLDLARYSDTKGYVYDREGRKYAHSFAYRDGVIKALNDDLPYDQLLMQQTAADQPVKAGHHNRNLAPTALLPGGPRHPALPH